MDPRLEPTAQLYNTNDFLFERAHKDFPAGLLPQRIDDKGNSFLWIAGHIVASRYSLANLLGIDRQWEHARLFKRGADIHPPDEYPSFEEIVVSMQEITSVLKEAFETVSPEKLDEAIPEGYPVLRNTVLFGASFLALHESYHVGQLAYVRRLHGQDRLVG